MRFYLDNDVDVACAAVLRAAGHEVTSASEVGMSAADDDEQTVYATDKGAVLITHDNEFTRRRRASPMGWHVRLKCGQINGPGLLAAALPELVPLLRAAVNMTVEIRPGRRGKGCALKPFYGNNRRPRPKAR